MSRPSSDSRAQLQVLLACVLLLSLAGNVFLGVQLLGGAQGTPSSVPLPSYRGTLSGEQRLGADMPTEYDFAFGLRKNMQLTKENCLLDECFLQMDLTLPVGTLPGPVADGLRRLSLQERQMTDLLEAHSKVQPRSRLGGILPAAHIRREVTTFLENKYGLSPLAGEAGVALSSAAEGGGAACTSMEALLRSQLGLYEAELARSELSSYPDLAFAYTQLAAQTRSVHLPLALSCR